MNDSITKEITYYVDGTGPDTELVVHAHGVTFRVETIPDGSMAGMQGHREIPWEATRRYHLGRELALELSRQLAEAAMRSSHG